MAVEFLTPHPRKFSLSESPEHMDFFTSLFDIHVGFVELDPSTRHRKDFRKSSEIKVKRAQKGGQSRTTL